ncbi:hypothetical protein niasHT_035736 [Heterodera trifolii]|uniref:BTB domain-containing protein n=1 Tax=Heterodera trifolii TaxID=157864 RepID=A0ABD2IRX1_9BILA
MSLKATTLKGRLAMILGNGEGADVHFLRIGAHKAVLIPASEVFRAMFRFDEKNSNFGGVDNPVEVPDVEAAAFKVMLRFIYTDGLSALNGDNAMAVLYAARKYGIDALADPCLQFPISTLRNVFLAYALATLLQLEDFAHNCLAYIDKNADSLIRSDDFLQIDQKTLCEILERDQLQICGEISIWKAPTKFSEIIVPSGILTMEEIVGVYQFYCHPNFQLLHPLKFRISDRHHATFVLDIEKFSEFARMEIGQCRWSNEIFFIDRLPWVIWIEKMQIDQSIWLAMGIWNGAEDFTRKFEDEIFNREKEYMGWNKFIRFSQLMDSSKGLYYQTTDKVALAIDFTVNNV